MMGRLLRRIGEGHRVGTEEATELARQPHLARLIAVAGEVRWGGRPEGRPTVSGTSRARPRAGRVEARIGGVRDDLVEAEGESVPGADIFGGGGRSGLQGGQDFGPRKGHRDAAEFLDHRRAEAREITGITGVRNLY